MGMKLGKLKLDHWRVIRFFVRGVEKVRRIKWLLFSKSKLDGPRPTRDLFAPGSVLSDGIYSKEALAPDLGLSPSEMEAFNDKGWAGPYRLLTPRGAALSMKVHEMVRGRFLNPTGNLSGAARTEHAWGKSRHAYVPEFYDLVRHPAIVDRVASILGPDLLAWGFTFKAYLPGKVHPWHIDVEHFRWKGVSVFLGLRNISLKSTLKVINGSQRLGQRPRELGGIDDESALAACLKFEKNAKIVPVPVGEGEFFIFDGPIWHGSKNTSFRTRYAAIIQYCRPDQKVVAPINYSLPVQWSPQAPPCVLARGEDPWGINQVVERP